MHQNESLCFIPARSTVCPKALRDAPAGCLGKVPQSGQKWRQCDKVYRGCEPRYEVLDMEQEHRDMVEAGFGDLSEPVLN
jgi:hypothetical protein